MKLMLGRLLRALATTTLLAFSAALLVWVYGIAGVFFPAAIGPHRRFFSSCLAIAPGASMPEARAAMAPYLEVGRTWTPPSSFPPGLFQAQVANISESPEEITTRVVFIPDAKNTADWCLVYPDRNGRILRVEISPD